MKRSKSKKRTKKGGMGSALVHQNTLPNLPKRPPWIDAWHVVSHATRATHHHPISAHTLDAKLYTVKGEK